MALRVYYLPNGDGVHGFLVAARNQREAVKFIHTTLGDFKAYGGRRTENPELVRVAMQEPGRVYKQKIGVVYGYDLPWEPEPWLCGKWSKEVAG